jgi:hypothetical protein
MEHAQFDFQDDVAELATLSMSAAVVLPATPASTTYRLSCAGIAAGLAPDRFSFVRPSLMPAPNRRVTRSASLRG